MKKIGIIGAGVMASGITRNFLKHNIEVYIWNRTPRKVLPLVKLGAMQCNSPKDVVSEADIIIECVSNTQASRSVWLDKNGILAGAELSKILIISSTVSTAWVDELAKTCKQKGFTFLDMPLTGGGGGAEAGTLCLLAGGSEDVLNSIKQELFAVSSHIFHFGHTGMGMRFKLIQNVLSSIHINAAIQASQLAKLAGIEPSRFYEAMSVGNMAPASPVTVSVLKDASTRPESPNFSIRILEKDLRYAQEWMNMSGIRFNLLDETLKDFVDSAENPDKNPKLSSIINIYREFDVS